MIFAYMRTAKGDHNLKMWVWRVFTRPDRSYKQIGEKLGGRVLEKKGLAVTVKANLSKWSICVAVK